MATYIYESIPANADDSVERYEFQQSMMDEPFVVHPESGQPIRRVITGGYGYAKSGGQAAPSASGNC